jgi:hypothetical protein
MKYFSKVIVEKITVGIAILKIMLLNNGVPY